MAWSHVLENEQKQSDWKWGFTLLSGYKPVAHLWRWDLVRECWYSGCYYKDKALLTDKAPQPYDGQEKCHLCQWREDGFPTDPSPFFGPLGGTNGGTKA